MPFDPNAFLQKYGTPAEGEAAPTGFDPDAFIKKYTAIQPTEAPAAQVAQPPAQPVQAEQPAPPTKEEPGLLTDISKGFQRIPASIAEQYEGIFSRKTAQMAKGNQIQTALYNMIDAGEVKSDSDLDKAYLKLMYGTDKLTAKQILDHGNLKQGLAGLDAHEYMNSSPEHRAAMRKGVETTAAQSIARFDESRARSKARDAELEKLAPRVKQFTDISSPYEAASWAAGRVPEFVGTNLPQIAAGYFTGPGGLALTSVIPELSGGTKERIKHMEGIVKNEPDPDKRRQALIDYVNKTQDVTLHAAVLNGMTDMIIGPEAEAVKLGAQSAFKEEIRKEILKKLPKVVGSEAMGEGATGAIQEITNMVAERTLGEMQGKVFTAENAKRLINSAADEALGGAGVSAGVQLTKAAMAKKNLADVDTPEGRAMRGLDDLAAREETGTPEEMTVPPMPSTPLAVFDTPEQAQERVNLLKVNRPKENFAIQETEDGGFGVFQVPVDTTGGANDTAPITDGGGTGAEDIGEPPSGTGAGVPPSSEGAGLGVSDTDATGAGAPEGIQPHTLTRKQFQEANTNLETFSNLFSPNFQITDDVDTLLTSGTEGDLQTASKIFGLKPVINKKRAAENLSAVIKKMKLAEDLNPAQVAEMKLPELKELANSLGISAYGNKDELVAKVTNFFPNLESKVEENIKNFAHEKAVRSAVVNGKPVSDEVLKDYPEIAAYATPLGSGAYTQAIKTLSKKMLPQHLMDVPNTARHLREDAEQSGDGRHATVLNDVADAMEAYYKTAFVGKKKEVPAEATIPTEEEVTALNDTIEKGVKDKLEGLLVGDEVRFGNTPGVVIGLEGEYAKFHPASASNPKAYTSIPRHQLTFVSRPNTNFTSASSKEPTKFGEESGVLDVDKARLTKTLGANMYNENLADVAVKEMLQNSFDSVKANVFFGKIKEGKINIKFDSSERTITITDNGEGMTPEIVKKAFFTIGGSHKAGVPMELQSGGFGMAKLGFIMGAESIKLDTVRDGVRTKVDATSADIGNDNFKLKKSPAAADEHGTTITVKIPKTYEDVRTGEDKSIYFPYGLYGVTALNRPLIGPVEVTTDFDGDKETLPIGVNFDFKEMPKLTTVKFPWGTADVYFGVERKPERYETRHRILSSGVYQFDYGKFNLGQNEPIPYDIIVDVKSAVEATDREYPFEKNRGSFNAVIEEDIASLAQYLAKVARGHEAEGLQETFKDIVTMPRTEVGKETAEASAKLRKVFDQRGADKGTYELPPMPKEITISQGIVKDNQGTVLVEKEKTKDKARESGFEADKAAPEMAQFLADMKQDPRQPIFHNNTNADLLEVGRKYGNPEQFFAELGTLVVEMKEELSKSGIWTYDQLSPDNLFFAGVSVDKKYGGVFIRVPFKGILLNPFYDWGAKTLFGVRQNYINTMIHEIAHQTTGDHDRSHENAMLKIEQHLADSGMLDYFRDAVLDILVKHESTFTAMREAYGRSTTKNVAKSLEDYGKSATSTEIGRDEGSGTDTSGELSERGEQVRGVDVRTDSGEAGTSEIGRGGPRLSVTNEEKIINKGMSSGNLSPDIIQAIANNDLNGALRLVANRLSGTKLWGPLATRLLELNLPTGIRIDDERNLTRRAIDVFCAPSQIQLFNYIRVAMPDVYSKYFQGYEKAENLEQVHAGLKHIQNNPKLKSVMPEYNIVRASYDNNMVAMDAVGVYFARFDEINLSGTRTGGLTYQVFLHEVVHAAVEILLQTPASKRTNEQNEAVAELEKLFKYAKDTTLDSHYGLTDLSEFIAEIFTSPSFIKDLKGIPYPPARTNIFNKFVKVIMDLIGMDNVAGRAMIEAHKLFNNARPNVLPSAGPRFARKPTGPVSGGFRVLEDVIKSVPLWTDVKHNVVTAMWREGNGVYRRRQLGMMFLRQIADASKTKFPQINTVIRTVEKMIAYRGKIMNEGGDILKKWTAAQSKSLQKSLLLGRVMVEATLREVEVDPKGPNYDAAKVNKEMADAWNALGSDFQEIYREVRDFYTNAINETVQMMRDRANSILDVDKRQKLLDQIDAQFGPGKLKGPYFPLRRFGDYWFQVGKGNFKEFYMFENAVSRTLAMWNRKNELSKGNATQQELAKTIKSGKGISDIFSKNSSTIKVLDDLKGIVDAIGDTVIDKKTGTARDKTVEELKSEVEDALNQLIYLLVPQQSMKKMFINRRGVQGASSDMLRVFATHTLHSAYQRSRFKYAPEVTDNLSNAYTYVQERLKYSGDMQEACTDVIKEVEKRVPNILGTEDTSVYANVAGKLSDATFYFYLTAPFTAALNHLSFWQTAMPYLSGPFGYTEANKAIFNNMKKYIVSTPERTFVPLKNGVWSQVSFPSIVESEQLTGYLKDAATQFIQEEQINISLTNDVLNLTGRPSDSTVSKYENIKRMMAMLFHQSERFNRELLLMSAVELSYDKLMANPIRDYRGVVKRDAQGQPEYYKLDATSSDGTKQYSKDALELAMNEAKDIAGLSLGDFTRQMKPRYLMNPGVALLTKFKQYAIMAFYMLYHNAKVGFIQPFSDKELNQLRDTLTEQYKGAKNQNALIERDMDDIKKYHKELQAEARSRLTGITIMSFFFAGALGAPFISTLLPILVRSLTDDDDKDEFFDWKNWFKNYMATNFSGYAASMLEKFGMEPETAKKAGKNVSKSIVYGPASVMSGGALTERMSLDPVSLFYRDAGYHPDLKEDVQQQMIANLGPVVGLGFNAIDAVKLFQEGQVGRAAEKLPAIVGKPLTAYRYATEGVKTRTGTPQIPQGKLDSTEIALQAIGLQPLRVYEVQKRSIEVKEKEQKILNQKTDIMNELWMSRNDSKAFSAAVNKAVKFSSKHPGVGIEGKDIQKSFKERGESEVLAQIYGARLEKGLRGELGGMTRYGRD